MRDEHILMITYGAGAVRTKRMALLRKWNARAKIKYHLDHQYIAFDSRDPEYAAFKKLVRARLPASCVEERICRHYDAGDAQRLKIRQLHFIGAGVDGSSTEGDFYKRQECPRCEIIRRRKIRPLTLNLTKAKGKDFVATYDRECVVSEKAKEFFQKYARGCCRLEPVINSGRASVGKYFHFKVLPVGSLAVPPTRILRSKECTKCGGARYHRGEWIFSRVPKSPMFRSDLEFGDPWGAGPAYFVANDLYERLLASSLTGWNWGPAWVRTDLDAEDLKRLVPRMDVTDIRVPSRKIPRKIWDDPED